jgi:DNA-binding transcriptional ArsR family regulator
MTTQRTGDVDIAAVGSLLGDRARVAMLTRVLAWPDSPAGELARSAGIAPSTAASHLQKLVDAGLLSVTRRGRLRLYQLSCVEVAHAIESLAVLAPAIPVRSFRQSRDSGALRAARSCYDHLAGRLGVTLHDELIGQRMIRRTSEQDYDITRKGSDLLSGFDVDVESLRSTRRVLARACLDWSERTPHLAGALGAALLEQFLDRMWLERSSENRSLKVTAQGRRGLRSWFSFDPVRN